MRQGWCIGLRLPVQLRANNQKHFDKDGYDEKLRANIKVGTPMLFDKNNITITPELKKVLDGRDIKDLPFYWGLQKAPDDFEII